MRKHVIYIPHLGREDLLSQQLAHAFAKHRGEFDKDGTDATMIVQYGLNLKPLELITPTDILQIMFTPVQNINMPLHAQTNAQKLLDEVPMLIKHLLQDGLNPDGCTIQLYTLEHSDQNAEIVKEVAKKLMAITHTKNLSIEWHIIPRLSSLTADQLNRIFQPNITCLAIIHAIPLDNGEIKLIEIKGGYVTKSVNLH
jgi:hypothetical protein